MKVKVKNPASQVQFDNVYISELSQVVHIYKNATTKIPSDKNNKLSIHFDLPLIIATNDDRLIGFASATLNLSGEMEMNCFFSEETNETDIENQLKEKAYRNFYRTYDNSETGKKHLKTSIERLVYWLNL